MSAETPENGGTEQENDPWNPAALRQLVPSTLRSEGQRALVCAIRNPDSTPGQVAEKCGLTSTYTVENAVRSAVQEVDREAVQYGQHLERRDGEKRDAETYGELTEKQQAIINFAAENPHFTEERTWSDVAQAIHEQEGVVVNETYVGQVLRKYPKILHRQRALASAEGENEVELEDALSEMTLREALGAAGFDLPSENQDPMPEAEVDSEQATLGDSRDVSGDFQSGSEVQEQQEAEDDGQEQGDSGHTYLSPEWVEQHHDAPGASVAQRLPTDAEASEVKQNTPYWGYVNGIAPYGVFVSLTHPPAGDDVSGLVTSERLYGKKAAVEKGDPMVVELDYRNAKGLALTDWRLLHPDEMQAEQERETDDDSEGEGTEAEAPLMEAAPQDEVLAALDERVSQQAQQMEVLAERIRGLREDAVMACEVAEFATEVENRLDEVAETQEVAAETVEDLDERLERVENGQADTVQDALEQAEQEVGAREQMEQRLGTLQEMVNALAEQVEQATTLSGRLGRAQRALQRLETDAAQVQAYEYSEQGGTVTLHVEATLPEGEQEDTDGE